MNILENSSIFPFERNTVISTSKFEEFQRALNKQITVEPRSIDCMQLTREAEFTVTSQMVNKTRLSACFHSDSIKVVSSPLTTYHLIIPLAGFITSNTHNKTIGIGEVVFFSPGEVVDIVWSQASKAVIVIIEKAQFDNYLRKQYLVTENTPSIPLSDVLSLASTAGSLGNIIGTICREGSCDSNMLSNERYTTRLEELLFEAFIGCQNNIEKLLRDDSIARPGCVKRAIDYVNLNINEDISMTDLVDSLNISKRTLERGFNGSYDMSPMAYIKRMKLGKVRGILQISSPNETTVGEISASFGFYHASNFTANYIRQFGEKPSDTLKKAT